MRHRPAGGAAGRVGQPQIFAPRLSRDVRDSARYFQQRTRTAHAGFRRQLFGVTPTIKLHGVEFARSCRRRRSSTSIASHSPRADFSRSRKISAKSRQSPAFPMGGTGPPLQPSKLREQRNGDCGIVFPLHLWLERFQAKWVPVRVKKTRRKIQGGRRTMFAKNITTALAATALLTTMASAQTPTATTIAPMRPRTRYRVRKCRAIGVPRKSSA